MQTSRATCRLKNCPYLTIVMVAKVTPWLCHYAWSWVQRLPPLPRIHHSELPRTHVKIKQYSWAVQFMSKKTLNDFKHSLFRSLRDCCASCCRQVKGPSEDWIKSLELIFTTLSTSYEDFLLHVHFLSVQTQLWIWGTEGLSPLEWVGFCFLIKFFSSFNLCPKTCFSSPKMAIF